MPIHAYTIPIRIHAAVHVYITFRLLMEGGMVRMYRIPEVMPQPAINIAKICFATSNGEVKNYNISNNNILYHLLGGM